MVSEVFIAYAKKTKQSDLDLGRIVLESITQNMEVKVTYGVYYSLSG